VKVKRLLFLLTTDNKSYFDKVTFIMPFTLVGMQLSDNYAFAPMLT